MWKVGVEGLFLIRPRHTTTSRKEDQWENTFYIITTLKDLRPYWDALVETILNQKATKKVKVKGLKLEEGPECLNLGLSLEGPKEEAELFVKVLTLSLMPHVTREQEINRGQGSSITRVRMVGKFTDAVYTPSKSLIREVIRVRALKT